jgi:DNA-binding NarL/FixJ family response regulator
MIQIALADDHALFRLGMRMILSKMAGISLCGEAENGIELLDLLQQKTVDLVLLDLEMKGMNGMDTLKQIRRKTEGPRVIILSMHTEPKMISYCMQNGANSYLPKEVQAKELETAIRTVMAEGIYLNERITRAMAQEMKNRTSKPTLRPDLSERELQILELICKEFTNREIGEKLFLSERTVEGHRKHLLEKLDVKNTVGIVKKAILLNLVAPG